MTSSYKTNRETLRLWAHRGGRKEVSENTYQALQHTKDLGLGWLETDVQLTADGVVVLHHNPDLAVPYHCPNLVSDTTWEELSKLRTPAGARPITLVQALEDFPQLYLNIEPKTPAVVASALQIVKKLGAVNRVSWAAFNSWTMARIRHYYWRERKQVTNPDMVVSPAYFGAEPLQVAAVKFLSSLGGLPHRWWQPVATAPVLKPIKSVLKSTGSIVNQDRQSDLSEKLIAGALGQRAKTRLQIPISFKGHTLLDQRFVATAHQLGIAVDVWTINRFEQAWELYQLGVDGIMTDYPAEFKSKFEAAGVNLERFC